MTVSFLLMATACNNDVFIEDPELSEDVEATIEGDGGEATFRIQTKGLERVSIEHVSDATGYTCYNKNGEEIPENSPVSELARINFTGIYTVFDVNIEGDRLTVQSMEYSGEWGHVITIRLEYASWIVRFIEVKVLPGAPMELVRTDYDEGFDVNDAHKTSERVMKATNNGPQPVKIEFKPWLAMQANAKVVAADSWVNFIGRPVDVRLPTYVDGRWVLGPEMNIRLDVKTYYSPRDWNVTVPVEIPANSTVNVVSTVTFGDAGSRGTFLFRIPVSAREFASRFTCEVVEPLSYEISIRDYTGE